MKYFSVAMLILILVVGCKKEDDENAGGGAIDCGYSGVGINDLPTLSWVLEGQQSEYRGYNTNSYFTFGSNWNFRSCNGKDYLHNGWDIHKADLGSIVGRKVYSSYKGTLRANYIAGDGWGRGVTIEHIDNAGNKFTTTYLHIDPIDGLSGTIPIEEGQLIGSVADLATNDHLHFSLRRAPYDGKISNLGALPQYQKNKGCECDERPIHPEYFLNPGLISFKTRASANSVFNLLTPSDGISNISVPITFSWTKLNGDAVYRIQISNTKIGWTPDNGFPAQNLIINENTGLSNAFVWDNNSVSPPIVSTTYYWTVRYYQNSITSSYVEPFSITTAKNGVGNQTRIISVNGSTNYINIPIGTTSTKTLSVKNSGTGNLSITSVTLPTDFSASWQNAVIYPSQTKDIDIIFKPTQAKYYSGNLVFNSDATSGNGNISLSAYGVNPTVTFNPIQNTYTNCPTSDIIGSGNCPGLYLKNTIQFRVSYYDLASNTITFQIKKCSGNFANSGTVYIKQGGYCGSVVAQQTFNSGIQSLNISVIPPNRSGTYQYTCVIVSSTTDKYHTEPIQVSY